MSEALWLLFISALISIGVLNNNSVEADVSRYHAVITVSFALEDKTLSELGEFEESIADFFPGAITVISFLPVPDSTHFVIPQAYPDLQFLGLPPR